jgi:hypothetical protein
MRQPTKVHIMKAAALLAVVLISGTARAAESEPKTQRTVDGFGGLLIVTPDKDWEKKWNTSPESIPYFSTGSTVRRGGELFILTLFANPKLDASGAVNVSMDIDVLRPDGSSSSHAENALCAEGKIGGPANSMFLCHQVIGFIGEPDDPAGTWTVRIVLRDEVRKVSMTLGTSFVLVDDPANGNP